MAIMYQDLAKEDKIDINENLRKHFDEVTYDSRQQWMMVYFQNDFEYFSNFETINEFLNEEEFEIIKLNLFTQGFSLYRMESRERIVLWSEREYYPNTFEINVTDEYDDSFSSLITFDTEEIEIKIDHILNTDHLIYLQEDDFVGFDGMVALKLDVCPVYNWDLAKEFLDSVGKVVIQITGTNELHLKDVSRIHKKIRSQFNIGTPVSLGVAINEDFQETVVESFILCKKEEHDEN